MKRDYALESCMHEDGKSVEIVYARHLETGDTIFIPDTWSLLRITQIRGVQVGDWGRHIKGEAVYRSPDTRDHFPALLMEASEEVYRLNSQ